MLDIKRIREDFDGVKKAVESRGKGDFGIDKVREYDVERRKLLAEVEQMKNQQSTSSRQIPVLKKQGAGWSGERSVSKAARCTAQYSEHTI